jgi:DNA-directed RNA polymerase subunit K/omega
VITCDTVASFSAPISRRRAIRSHSRLRILVSHLTHLMKDHLVKAASEVIHNQQILVNMVSRRVRQLCLGHRPLVEFVPGLGHADVALSEIANGKLTFESTLEQGEVALAEIVQFPGTIKKTSPKKAA